ncbi:hypothetical protein EIN_516050 [Entamoeba invadens IP1]|uniref:Uncharacterized protein n=1 Tax=Entamoeba invadens IP1 TaxID=370355 RepID=L7FKC1_ENTIV|nr:hypothetical protein EIN_516050 [Entamoeba invadens IP1]ELP86205.1 hypothetical protein EIN_516050 [Entamoeba invadens IP1]|eukprot:XP_004185551.1 hypothetical protein EIN_516050 [Entamoeba invadens IP1]
MFSLLLAIASAKYLISTTGYSVTIYKDGQCYYDGDNTYYKYVEEGDNIQSYKSSTCSNWIKDEVIPKGANAVVQDDLPEYYYMFYEYKDAKDCIFSEKDANPIEYPYSECTQTGDSSSEKASKADGKVSYNVYNTKDCSGTAIKEYEPVELEKCLSNNRFYTMYSEGEFEVFAMLALFIACLL